MSPDGHTLTCDPDIGVCDFGVSIYAVNYASTDTISVFGECKISGTFEQFCCVAEDAAGDITKVHVFGTEESDERIAFTVIPSGTRYDLKSTAGQLLEATATGRAGNDTIYGSFSTTNYKEELNGDNGNDSIDGNDGDDTLNGGWNADTMEGGNGNDTLFGGGHRDILYGNDGDDTLYGEGGLDELWGDGNPGESGNDQLFGGNHDDEMHGGPGVDVLKGGAANDTIYGDEGDDTIEGQNGDDTIEGGDGEDTIEGQNGNDIIDGGDDDDTILGGDGNDTIEGGEGVDYLHGGKGTDTLSGDGGNDVLYGGIGMDTLNGGADNDYLCDWHESGADPCPASNTYNGGGGFDRAFMANGFEYGSQWCASMQQLGSQIDEASQSGRDWSLLTSSPTLTIVDTIYPECTAITTLGGF
jgi:Ca2+-binding RTX toxin-like protein